MPNYTWPERGKRPWDTELKAIVDSINAEVDGRLGEDELSATFVAGGAGLKYALVAGALRNDGAGWYVIDNETHHALNIDGISQAAQSITIDYSSLGGVRTVALVAVADEALAKAGITAGASVGPDETQVYLHGGAGIADYVSYNGSSWVSADGVFTAANFTSGVLTLTHSPIAGKGRGVTLTPRGPTFRPVVTTNANNSPTTQIMIEFYDSAGVKATTPTTDMKVFVSRDAGAERLDVAGVTTALFPNSNIWIYGVVELA